MGNIRTGLPLIRAFEGCRLSAYRCPAGVWTIAYGHTHGVKEGDTCTLEQAVAWLTAEYDSFEAGVLKLLNGHPATPAQLGALVSFAYNLGTHALAGSTLLRRHLACDYCGAASEFAKWNKAGGRVLPGLVRRRAAEAALYAL